MPTIPEIESRYLPQIAAARAAAEERRDEAWLPEVPHTVAGVPVRALTPRDYLTLVAIGNAYLAPVAPPAEPAAWHAHSAQFLWVLSADYRPGDGAAARRWSAKHIRPLDPLAVHTAIEEYLQLMFADRPRPVETEADAAAAPLTVPASWLACWVHEFAQAYGWSPAEVLALSFPQIFQLRQLLRFEASLKRGERPPPAGDEADLLAAACFAEIAALA